MMGKPGLSHHLALTQRGLLEEAFWGKTSVEGWGLRPSVDIDGLWPGCAGAGRLWRGDGRSQIWADWTTPSKWIFCWDLKSSMKNTLSIPTLLRRYLGTESKTYGKTRFSGVKALVRDTAEVLLMRAWLLTRFPQATGRGSKKHLSGTGRYAGGGTEEAESSLRLQGWQHKERLFQRLQLTSGLGSEGWGDGVEWVPARLWNPILPSRILARLLLKGSWTGFAALCSTALQN